MRSVLKRSTARARRDACCALAWGARLAKLADAALAADVLRRDGAPALDAREKALSGWAERIALDPNATTAADIDALRNAGLTDREILEATVYISLRLAFATVNDALGAQPDPELVAEAPPEVRAAVTYGRPPA